jgi:DNA-directed RNA polymerase subunit RPC12/RpoP
MNQRFACPTCDAALEDEGQGPTVRCAYCGTVVIVPEAMRRDGVGADPAAQPAARPAPSPAQTEAARQKQQAINEMMELVRAGRLEEAAQLYEQNFKVSQKEAKKTVAQLAAGQRRGQDEGASLTERLSGLFGGLFGSDD